eukprot:Sspe_Gene.89871::Locus_61541_Transcript_1_1_Confidence_1.000_Length_1789::g.89871::m.89871
MGPQHIMPLHLPLASPITLRSLSTLLSTPTTLFSLPLSPFFSVRPKRVLPWNRDEGGRGPIIPPVRLSSVHPLTWRVCPLSSPVVQFALPTIPPPPSFYLSLSLSLS